MPDPVVAQKTPFVQKQQPGSYYWCACGLSKTQPFCDGSHTSTKSGIKPVVWTQDKDQTAFLCGCKHGGSSPFCDGSHKKL